MKMNKKHMTVRKAIIPTLTIVAMLVSAGSSAVMGMTSEDIADIVNDVPEIVFETAEQAQQSIVVAAETTQSTATSSQNASLTDISGHWAMNDILYLVARGGIKGYADGTFKPNNSITTAELASILIGASGNNNAVTSGSWAAGIMEKAKALGITDLVEGNNQISREQMADMLIRSAEKLFNENTNSADTVGIAAQINDYATIGAAYQQSVIKCYAMGLLTGKGSGYDPKGYTTRAEAATICARVLDTSRRIEFNAQPLENTGWVYPAEGTKIVVNGVEYTITRDKNAVSPSLPDGVLGVGIPTGLWNGMTLKNGVVFDGSKHRGSLEMDPRLMGQPYIEDERTGEWHFAWEWVAIGIGAEKRIQEQYGGKNPTTPGLKFDIFGNKIEKGSNTTVYYEVNDDGVLGTWMPTSLGT
jgi:hypothetical protein